MKSRSKYRFGSLVGMSVLLLTSSARSRAQQPVAPSSASSPSAQVQSAPPTDLGAQIDELIKQCNEQMNVKGQFKEAKESAQQALDLRDRKSTRLNSSHT